MYPATAVLRYEHSPGGILCQIRNGASETVGEPRSCGEVAASRDVEYGTAGLIGKQDPAVVELQQVAGALEPPRERGSG